MNADEIDFKQEALDLTLPRVGEVYDWFGTGSEFAILESSADALVATDGHDEYNISPVSWRRGVIAGKWRYVGVNRDIQAYARTRRRDRF